MQHKSEPSNNTHSGEPLSISGFLQINNNGPSYIHNEREDQRSTCYSINGTTGSNPVSSKGKLELNNGANLIAEIISNQVIGQKSCKQRWVRT